MDGDFTELLNDEVSSMISYKVGYEYADPENVCYKYVCSLLEKPNWMKLFDNLRCCQYNSSIIQIGDSIRISNISNANTVAEEDLRCSEKLVLCKPAEDGEHQPNIEIYELPFAKCCVYENKILQLHETLLDAEVCVLSVFICLHNLSILFDNI